MSHSTYPKYWSQHLQGYVSIPSNEVDPQYACPECGERAEDKLIWTSATYELLDGSTETSALYVKCAVCGYCYELGAEPC